MPQGKNKVRRTRNAQGGQGKESLQSLGIAAEGSFPIPREANQPEARSTAPSATQARCFQQAGHLTHAIKISDATYHALFGGLDLTGGTRQEDGSWLVEIEDDTMERLEKIRWQNESYDDLFQRLIRAREILQEMERRKGAN
jgi:hypothetical protein